MIEMSDGGHSAVNTPDSKALELEHLRESTEYGLSRFLRFPLRAEPMHARTKHPNK